MILVTGGTGFLGSTLIDFLLEKNVKIRATKRNASIIPQRFIDHPLIEWVNVDFSNYFEIHDVISDVKQVYHCAATVSYSKKDISKMQKMNVEGTAHLVNLCLDHHIRLLHVSSIAAIGNSKNGEIINEKHFWEYGSNNSAYSISKYESEMEVWRGIEEGLDAVIINPSLIIGPSAGIKGSGSIFHLLSKGLKFYTGGSTGVVDVEDVAKSMIVLMGKTEITGERFIINNVNISHKELLKKTSHFMGVKEPSVEATYWMLNTARLFLEIKSLFTKEKSVLTRDSIRVSLKSLQYSNKKFVKATQYQFKPLEETLQAISLHIKNLNNSG